MGGVRLKLICLPKNTGTPGLPRNVGIQLARGKYIAFLDSDDLFTKTALEELTTLAEKFQADVVWIHKHFTLWDGVGKSIDAPEMTNFAELTDPKNFKINIYRRENLNKPTLESEEIGERVSKWLSFKANGFWRTWLFFYRHDFLIANQITFSAMTACEDLLFAFEGLCLAKRYLSVPNIVNIERSRIDSTSKDDWQSRKGEKFFIKRFRVLKEGFKKFEEIMDKVPFFEDHPDSRYAVFDWFANHRINLMRHFYTQNPPFLLNEFVKKEFCPNDMTFAAYIFNTLNIYRLRNIQLQQELKKFQQQ